MKRFATIIFSFLSFAVSLAWADGVGSWKYYPAYNGVSSIDSVSRKCVYVLSSGNLYSVNMEEGSIDTYTRLTGLTDSEISLMKWNRSVGALLLVYSNSNIDIMRSNGDVTNIPDIFMKATTLNKSVNSIFMTDEYAYLSMGFGIAKVNMRKGEISDSYNLNENIAQCYLSTTDIYAKTKEGKVLKASLKDNLLDHYSWKECSENTDAFFAQEKNNDGLIARLKNLYPNGPRYGLFGRICYHNGRLYTCENNGWDNNDKDCPQIYDIANDSWTVMHDDDNAIRGITGMEYCNFTAVEVDPTNDNHIMVGGKGGVYEFLAGKLINFYTDTNSPLTSAIRGNSEYVLPTALKTMPNGNTWIALSQAIDGVALLSLSKDEKWEKKSFDKWFFANASWGKAKDMIVDSRGILWWGNDHWNNPSLSGYDPATGTAYCYNTFYNEDNTKVEVGAVRTVCEDREGNLWIGTNVGPLMLEKDKVKSGGDVTWQQVKVPRNDGTNYADYLLAGVDITSIIVDGANRKWFASNGNGIYLIDSDNITQIHNFTSMNSMLLSDAVLTLELDPSHGDLYIGTTKGLCSYRTDATQPVNEMDEDSVYAYPNPVTPDYSGPITITGLSFDADVKITTSNGHLVAKGRSNGGSFTWYGKDMSGKNVASGVYMVLVSDRDGNKGVVTKIAVVR